MQTGSPFTVGMPVFFYEKKGLHESGLSGKMSPLGRFGGGAD